MITTLTVCTGMGLLLIMIARYEYKSLKHQITQGINELTKPPTQKPVKCGTFKRVTWIKDAPLHLVIKH